MTCPRCNGTGDDCLACEGSGELCDVCGEATEPGMNVCAACQRALDDEDDT